MFTVLGSPHIRLLSPKLSLNSVKGVFADQGACVRRLLVILKIHPCEMGELKRFSQFQLAQKI